MVHPPYQDDLNRGVDYYDLLGVPANAERVEIIGAFRRRIRDVHPDLGGTSAETVLLLRARDTLLSPDALAYKQAWLRRDAVRIERTPESPPPHRRSPGPPATNGAGGATAEDEAAVRRRWVDEHVRGVVAHAAAAREEARRRDAVAREEARYREEEERVRDAAAREAARYYDEVARENARYNEELAQELARLREEAAQVSAWLREQGRQADAWLREQGQEAAAWVREQGRQGTAAIRLTPPQRGARPRRDDDDSFDLADLFVDLDEPSRR